MAETTFTEPGRRRPPLLEVRGLNAWYGAAHILFDLDFHVDEGEVVALTGRNGAGKSTTLKAVMGMLARTSGEVFFAPGPPERSSAPDKRHLLGRPRHRVVASEGALPHGQPIAGLPTHRIARLGLGYVPEERRIFTDLTVRENLETGRQPPRPGLPAWTEEKLFAMFPNLATMPNRRGQHMSGGEQQMLTIARTLMGNPRMVLLDEPSEGVAPIIVDQMAAVITDLRQQGLTVLLSEQNERFVDRVGARKLVLEQGRLV